MDLVSSILHINHSTLSGAIDIIVVEHPDGTLKCTPFHVRFGKMKVLRASEKIVDIEVNGHATDLKMMLGDAGEAFFFSEAKGNVGMSSSLSPSSESPLSSRTLMSQSDSDAEENHEVAYSWAWGAHPTLVDFVVETSEDKNGNSKLHNSFAREAIILDVEKKKNDGVIAKSRRVIDRILRVRKKPNYIDKDPDPDHGYILRIHKNTSDDQIDTPSSEMFSDLYSNNQQLLDFTDSQSDHFENDEEDELPFEDDDDYFADFDEEQLHEYQNESLKVFESLSEKEGGYTPLFIPIQPQSSSLTNSPTWNPDDYPSAPSLRVDMQSSPELPIASSTLASTAALAPAPAPVTVDPEPPSFPPDLMHSSSLPSLPSPSSTTEFRNSIPSPLPSSNLMAMFSPNQPLPIPSSTITYPSLRSAHNSSFSPALSSSNVTAMFSPHQALHVPSYSSNHSAAFSSNSSASSLLSSPFTSCPSNPVSFLQSPSRHTANAGVSSSPSPSPSPSSSALPSLNGSASQLSLLTQQLNQSSSEVESSADSLSSSLSSPSNDQLDCALLLSKLTLDSLKPPFFEASNCGDKLFSHNNPEKDFIQELFDNHKITYEKLISQYQNVVSGKGTANLVIRVNQKYLVPWTVVQPILFSIVFFGKSLDYNVISQDLSKEFSSRTQGGWMRMFRWGRSRSNNALLHGQSNNSTPIGSNTNLGQSNSAISQLSSSTSTSTPILISHPSQQQPSIRKVVSRSLRPTQEQIRKLGLVEGANTITFKVMSDLRGIQQVTAALYFWSSDQKIVISDIDGTITKSDALGHIMPILGRDWSHSGVAKLYSSITGNGYKIVYLTSRAIGQAETTRRYINGLNQEGEMLPPGPLLLSPDRLFTAFNREVIRRRPEEFKIACLQDLKTIFPDSNPFYAGFGNRPTDVKSYRAVEIPLSKIFIINPKGVLSFTSSVAIKKSYSQLNDIVELAFPSKKDTNPEYNDFAFWKLPLSPIGI